LFQNDFSDTTVAPATPPGVGAIAVLRLSGSKALSIASRHFKGKDLENAPSHTIHLGKFTSGVQVIDEVLVSLFKAPASYTKEDVVEISCHGSPYIQQKIMETLIDSGARPAKPGEFTMRAFLNGRFDLSQAEAVADLIAAETEIQRTLAMRQLRGGFTHDLKFLREKLIHFASMIELELDFGEEDVEFADRDDLKSLIVELQQHLEALVHSFKFGNVVKNGITTVLAGRPNAGKSTLLNALLNEERAIVSEIAGTTRDVIEEKIVLGGLLFRLIDTAGIREATDIIEKIGVEKTFEQVANASILLYIFDASELSTLHILEDIEKLKHDNLQILLIANKTDLIDKHHLGMLEFSLKAAGCDYPVFEISALNKENISELTGYLSSMAGSGTAAQEQTVVTNVRHYQSLQQTQSALQHALDSLEQNTTGDFLAQDIRYALHALGEITGDITTDDLLDNIFSKFCIGK
jgi:tRNA modification GTPase